MLHASLSSLISHKVISSWVTTITVLLLVRIPIHLHLLVTWLRTVVVVPELLHVMLLLLHVHLLLQHLLLLLNLLLLLHLLLLLLLHLLMMSYCLLLLGRLLSQLRTLAKLWRGLRCGRRVL